MAFKEQPFQVPALPIVLKKLPIPPGINFASLSKHTEYGLNAESE